MALVGIGEPSASGRGWAPFALGFRPFFLLAGIGAVLLLGAWALAFELGALPGNYYGFIGWHSHEMLYGYAVAVIAGFLLTATRNWTGVQTLRGAPLAALAGLWLAGRLLPFLPLPPGLVVAVDLAFLPLLALALAVPVLRAQHYRSLMFVALLLALALGNLLVHLEVLGVAQTAQRGLYLGLHMVLLVMVIMGGRVIAYFTERALPGFERRHHAWIEQAAPASLLAVAALHLLWPQPLLLGTVMALAGVVNLLRVADWYTPRIWGVPLLWVLHAGYAWLGLGLLLSALGQWGVFPPMSGLHALTVGSLGVLTLGMMARVSLGHTGRMLAVGPAMNVAFALVNGAALVRVFGPALLPAQHGLWVGLAGALWVLAFGLFLERYFMVLLRPRVDGQPG